MSAIRFVLTAAFMLVGLFVCCVGVYGVFKLKYAANRMHAAALNDTLGVSFCLVGLAISALIIGGCTKFRICSFHVKRFN